MQLVSRTYSAFCVAAACVGSMYSQCGVKSFVSLYDFESKSKSCFKNDTEINITEDGLIIKILYEIIFKINIVKNLGA